VRHLLTLTFTAAVLAGTTTAAAAQQTRTAILLPPQSLEQHLHDADLVLLHVGDKTEYDAQHIPGARYVSLRDISASEAEAGGQILAMPEPEALRQKLAALGISDDSRIVVYYGKDWVSPATRVVFTLDYAGLGNRAVLLDGGMQAWIARGQPVTDAVSPAKTGSLSPLRIRPIVVDAAFVKDHLGKKGFSVIDGRGAAFYDGVSVGGPPNARHRAGHIAGAKSVPFTEVADDRNFIRPTAELAALFAKAGVQPGDTIVGYCHIGQQATAMLFAARSLGYPVLLYDGSFDDWSRRTELPVETTEKKP
jgi:thiosulfate/3-mercaptopyruvate sulfurtransferase